MTAFSTVAILKAKVVIDKANKKLTHSIMKRIVRLQFIDLLAAKLSITRPESERILLTTLKLIMELACAGNEVVFSGFGKFSVKDRHARLGVNPREWTKSITIKAGRTPRFKAGEQFKALANRF